jgi:MFS family permease
MDTDNPANGQGLLRRISALPILQPLRAKTFRLVWFSESISLFGSQFYLIALSWLTLQVTGSGLALGTVLTVSAVPRAVLILVGGAASDRLSPRKLMMACNVVRGAVLAAVTAIIFTGLVKLWHLYVLAVFFGTADAFYHPSLMAIFPRIVRKEQLNAGNAILRGTQQLGSLVGAAPAGLLIASMGTGAAFGVNALSFALSTIALGMVNEASYFIPMETDVPDLQGRSAGIRRLLRDIKEGLRYAWKTPGFRSLLIAIALIDFGFAGPLDVGLAWMAANRYTGGAVAFGATLSAFGAGAMLGAVLAGSLKLRRRGLLFAFLSVVTGIGLGLFGFIFGLAPLVANALVIGVCVGLINVTFVAWLQQTTHISLLGRVMSLVMFSSVGMGPVSFALAGVLVEHNAAIMFAAAGGLVVLASILLSFSRAVRAID